jgi:hypothetical protein
LNAFELSLRQIEKWENAAHKTLEVLLATDESKAIQLDTDIVSVEHAVWQAIEAMVPDSSITKPPKNFFAQLLWLASNIGTITALIGLVSGQDPFTAVEQQSRDIATKWGFYAEVYGA